MQVFRSLSHRPFRHYFIGQTVSLIGFWLQSIAVSWLVYRLTGSAVMLGAVVFATSIPMLVLMPAAGILTDRVDRRRLVIMTQSVQMVQALVLALLTFTGMVSVSVIMLLALVQGVAAAFDAPVRQALLTVMVPTRAELPNAIALNSLIMNLARFVGPALAGVLLDVLGEGWCFLLNGVSFLAVLISMFRLPAQPAQPSRRSSRRLAGRAVRGGMRRRRSSGGCLSFRRPAWWITEGRIGLLATWLRGWSWMTLRRARRGCVRATRSRSEVTP